jgi:DnaJ-domain-containing protein 1
LNASTLGDLLGALHRAQASGVLELVERAGATAGRRHRLHFDTGLVTDVESPIGARRIGEILTENGVVGRDALARLTRLLVIAPGRRAGELMVENGLASVHAVTAALRHQLRARLDALFSLRDAAVSFHVAGRRWAARHVPLSPPEFLHGRPRARDRGRASKALRSDPVRSRALRTLGLPSAAELDDVRQAFRALAAKSHPDRFPYASATERALLMRRFAELSAAYHTLIAS